MLQPFSIEDAFRVRLVLDHLNRKVILWRCALFDKEGKGVNSMDDPELSPAPLSLPVKYLVNVVKCSYPQSNQSVVAANK